MNFVGTIIEESLIDLSMLKKVRLISKKVEPIQPTHMTPWLKQWTLDKVEVLENQAENIAKEISKNLDYSHKNAWYADFKNKDIHYIIFKNKIFKIDINRHPQEYLETKTYGINLSIPDYQVNFEKFLVQQ